MKKSKILVLLLAVVMAFSVVALAACGGGKDGTAEGEYSYFAYDYANQKLSDTNKYGCKVTVTVTEGKISAVVVAADTATFYNVSSGWGEKENWLTNGGNFAQSFINKAPADVMKIKVSVTEALDGTTPAGQPKSIEGLTGYVTGATQSSGRLILAIQNALSKLGF